MPSFDFKKYHVRGMNASSEAEKQTINNELKAYYESLSDAEKVIFNDELQAFLIKEFAAIKSVYDGVNQPTSN